MKVYIPFHGLPIQEINIRLNDKITTHNPDFSIINLSKCKEVLRTVKYVWNYTFEELGSFRKVVYSFPNLQAIDSLEKNENLSSMGLGLFFTLYHDTYMKSETMKFDFVCITGALKTIPEREIESGRSYIEELEAVEDIKIKFDNFINMCKNKWKKELHSRKKACFIYINPNINEEELKSTIPIDLQKSIKVKQVKNFKNVTDFVYEKPKAYESFIKSDKKSYKKKPEPPQNVKVYSFYKDGKRYDKRLKIVWDKVEGADKYVVYRFDVNLIFEGAIQYFFLRLIDGKNCWDNFENYKQISKEIEDNYYIDKVPFMVLVSPTDYFYKILAKNKDGDWSEPSKEARIDTNYDPKKHIED